ncbi:hypothetical protein Bca52824_049631 [Brassica carinata]|uniref:Uncharacterized protein n=1 Tax=Brassica carinata TaxID=52824 RepID=A0A8X7UT78_BRACI|nr:hypothetical protein Bca52824_049631 [Brassica carinata]
MSLTLFMKYGLMVNVHNRDLTAIAADLREKIDGESNAVSDGVGDGVRRVWHSLLGACRIRDSFGPTQQNARCGLLIGCIYSIEHLSI